MRDPITFDTSALDDVNYWSDVSGWRQQARAFGARLRAHSWDDMAREIAAVVERA